jgi:hypothetical protein
MAAMSRSTPIGFIAELWRFPVKSMQGERLGEAQVTAHGILGDRTLALLDPKTGRIVTASDTRLSANLLDCHADFVEAPASDGAVPPVRITLPDGTTAMSDSPELPDLLAACFGRELLLAHATPVSYSARQTAFFEEVGIGLPPTRTFVDYCPLSLITSSTLDTLATSRPGARFDLSRFRMNIKVTTDARGCVENAWVNRQLQLGATVRLAVPMADPRCVVTTLPQGVLPKDPGIFRTIAEVNTTPVGTGGPLPCAGVYAEVLTSGAIRLGDPVLLV